MFGIDLLGFARDMYEQFMNMFVAFISVTIDFSTVEFVMNMIGNAQGVGLVLAGIIAVLMVVGAIVARRFRLNAVISTVVALTAPFIFMIWLGTLDGFRSVGANLNGLIVGIDTAAIKSNIALPFPGLTIGAAMWNVPIFVLSGITCLWFMIVFAMMSLLNVALAVGGIFFLAFYGFGPRSRRNFSIVLSISIVTFCIGQPIVLGIIKIANVIGNAMPVIPGSVGLAGLFGLAGLWFAAGALLALPLLMYFPVHAIAGKVNASVSNRVNSNVSNKPKVDANVKGQVHTTQHNRLASAQKASYRNAMSAHLRRQVGDTGSAALMAMLKKSTAVAAAAGSKVHPVTAAAYTGGAMILRGVGNAPSKPKREKDYVAYK